MILMIQIIVTSVVPLSTEGLLLTDLATADIPRSFILLKHVVYCDIVVKIYLVIYPNLFPISVREISRELGPA
jgi:hypothetical protein